MTDQACTCEELEQAKARLVTLAQDRDNHIQLKAEWIELSSTLAAERDQLRADLQRIILYATSLSDATGMAQDALDKGHKGAGQGHGNHTA